MDASSAHGHVRLPKLLLDKKLEQRLVVTWLFQRSWTMMRTGIKIGKMKDYRVKFQAEYRSLDVKPKKRNRKYIEGSNRVKAKKQIKKELDREDK